MPTNKLGSWSIISEEMEIRDLVFPRSFPVYGSAKITETCQDWTELQSSIKYGIIDSHVFTDQVIHI